MPTEIRLLCDHSVTASLDYPLFVKPARADGSFGIGSWFVADNRQSLLAAVDRLKHQHGVSDIVVQEFLSGREYTVGIIGNVESGLTVLPIIEVDYSALPSGPHIHCHDSKNGTRLPRRGLASAAARRRSGRPRRGTWRMQPSPCSVRSVAATMLVSIFAPARMA